MKQVVIVGAGAAGLMAAITAADRGAAVTLIEKNEKIGKKIYITGKGRCNLTNACPVSEFYDNVPTNPKFLYSSVRSFDSADLCAFFENAGLKLKTERGNRVFPASEKSSDVIKALKKECERAGVKIMLNTAVQKITQTAGEAAVSGKQPAETSSDILFADTLIIATGGLSYPSTGSTGDGYRFAGQFGHRIVPQIPSLVPIRLKEPYVCGLEGLSLRNVSVKIAESAEAKPLYEGFGEMLFTNDGVSGPLILTASSAAGRQIARKNGLKLFIDLKPALDHNQLDARILRDFEASKNKEYKNALQKLLPAKMIPVIIKESGIDPETRVNQISKMQRAQLVRAIRQLTFTICGLDGFEKAVVTKGGVDVKSVNPKTMESKLVPGLYFAGEVLDVDAYTGGFNLQIAFSTGRAAGLAAAQTEDQNAAGLAAAVDFVDNNRKTGFEITIKKNNHPDPGRIRAGKRQ